MGGCLGEGFYLSGPGRCGRFGGGILAGWLSRRAFRSGLIRWVYRRRVLRVANLRGWLTTVTGRVCLDMLRARGSRREQPWGIHVPDPLVSPADGVDPEQEALLGESVRLALHVVLEILIPAERLAFVLHDMFAVPFDDIATMVGRAASRS